MQHSLFRRAAVFAVCAGSILAACGGDDDAGGGSAADTTPASSAESAPPEPSTAPGPTTPGTDAGGSTAPTPGEPVVGGTLRIRPSSELASLDPIASPSQTGGDRLYAIFGALAVQDYATSEVIPVMAESVETTDGGTTWVIKIRPGITFTDGTPYDAEAVVLNWDRSADPANASLAAANVAAFESYEATDDLTVTAVLKVPNTQWPISLGSTALSYIASPTAIAALGADFGNQPVGAGPFVVESYQRDSQLVLTRNPDYFDAPRPYLDELIFQIIPDESQAVNTFSAGQLDVVRFLLDTTAKDLEGKAEVVPLPQISGAALGMDTGVAPFDDPSFRRALTLTMNSDLVTKALDPEGTGTTTLFNEGIELYSPDLAYPTPDLAEAQQLLDDYRAAHGGGEISITYNFNEPQRAAAEAIQGLLSQLSGLKIEIQGYAQAEFVTLLRSKQVVFGQWTLSGSWGEPQMYDVFHTDGAQNWFNYSNPDVDAALELARSTEDHDEQVAAYREAGQYVVDDLVFVSYDPSMIYYATTSAVHDFRETAIYAGLAKVDDIWLDGASQ